MEYEHEDELVERLVNLIWIKGGQGYDELFEKVKHIQHSRVVVIQVLEVLVSEGHLIKMHTYYYLG